MDDSSAFAAAPFVSAASAEELAPVSFQEQSDDYQRKDIGYIHSGPAGEGNTFSPHWLLS